MLQYRWNEPICTGKTRNVFCLVGICILVRDSEPGSAQHGKFMSDFIRHIGVPRRMDAKIDNRVARLDAAIERTSMGKPLPPLAEEVETAFVHGIRHQAHRPLEQTLADQV